MTEQDRIKQLEDALFKIVSTSNRNLKPGAKIALMAHIALKALEKAPA
jgi:hypothetical protein